MKKFRFICVYTKSNKGANRISPLDAAPGYLHIHALDAVLLNPASFNTPDPMNYESGVLYQWGVPEDKILGQRKPVISESQRKQYGSLGIGSVCNDGHEELGEFVGGGEGFIYGSQAYRVTRGNTVFRVKPYEHYWTVQTTPFKNTIKIDTIHTVTSRTDLVTQVLSFIGTGDTSFIATFIGHAYKKDVFFRSNGIIGQDKVFNNKDESVFDSEFAVGGHMIGDSTESGDLIMPKNYRACVNLSIVGTIEVEIIKKIKIGTEGDPQKFRMPRYLM